MIPQLARSSGLGASSAQRHAPQLARSSGCGTCTAQRLPPQLARSSGLGTSPSCEARSSSWVACASTQTATAPTL
eukprot:1249963-Pyramimonas_sp.AAC.1